MELKNGITTFYGKSRKAWRKWLEQNHAKEQSVWLIMYRKETGVPSVYYSEAVDEALCFGWIDSKPNKRDDESYYQFFSRRKPKSVWSLINKKKVEVLLQQGLITPAGMAAIETAQQNGSWAALDAVDALAIPAEMEALLRKNKKAATNFHAFPPSAKKGILQWIQGAKTTTTRIKRITETVTLAAQNIRANQYIKK
jgi:uncharacterized protein YdeI (YjbR/CyaY-like superfamily)